VGSASFKLLWATYANQAPLAPVINWPIIDSQVAVPQFISPNALLLNQQIYYINIKELGKLNQHSNGYFYTFSIPVNSNSNDLIIYNEDIAYEQWVDLNNRLYMNTFTVELRDQNNALVDIHNSEWYMVLKYSE